MFGSLGMGEMIVIFLVVLLLFGAKRLPEIGSSLGKGIREFKGSIREIEREVQAVEEPKREAVPPPSASSDEQSQEPRRLTTNPPPSEQQIGGVPTAPDQEGDVPPQAASSDAEDGQDGPTEVEATEVEDVEVDFRPVEHCPELVHLFA